MRNIVITGADGFIGKNLAQVFRERAIPFVPITRATSLADCTDALRKADAVFHLAGVNRPSDPEEFAQGNRIFTEEICTALARAGRKPTLIFASSIQAAQDNPYGTSKLAAEQNLQAWADHGNGTAIIYRLPNVFGKWCRPHYNSVVATLCHQISRAEPITIHDAARVLELAYIDDVVALFASHLDRPSAPGLTRPVVTPVYRVSLGDLARKLTSFADSRTTLELPSMVDDFTRKLYATYLSYLPGPRFAYNLARRTDARGSLAEFIKQPHFGQVFISRTVPGVTRGHHYHHTKAEKFFVVEGEAIVRFRHLLTGETYAHRVNGSDFKVIDIPPGFAHSIENIGDHELVTLFWASEIFDPSRPDTHGSTVPAFISTDSSSA